MRGLEEVEESNTGAKLSSSGSLQGQFKTDWEAETAVHSLQPLLVNAKKWSQNKCIHLWDFQRSVSGTYAARWNKNLFKLSFDTIHSGANTVAGTRSR